MPSPMNENAYRDNVDGTQNAIDQMVKETMKSAAEGIKEF